MLVEKEVIRPGTYWYRDETTGLPRKLVVTPALTKYWAEQGNKMLSCGLTVPVPYEHDFSAHPMTPKDKLLNNAGEVKEYRLRGDALFSAVDVQDPDVKRKIGHSIRWTSPWISSFTDGDGREWNNVISHLALTTRPRIVKQAPFGSIAAALSLATEVKLEATSTSAVKTDTPAPAGFCLSRAGRLSSFKGSKRSVPRYPIAFSLWAGGVKLGVDDMPPAKKKKGDDAGGGSANSADPTGIDAEDYEDTDALLPALDGAGGGTDVPPPDNGAGGLSDPLADANGDISMEELLCDLLQALGVPMPDQSNEHDFKRNLYEATMSKIKELTSKGLASQNGDGAMPDQNAPPDQQPHASQPQQNPLIQQEQQPMFMSLEDINKISDATMKNVALSMYAENQKLRAEADTDRKRLNSLNDAKIREEDTKRQQRVQWLSRLSPKVKADLDAMLALPSMALSMGDGGAVVDPMAQTLAVLEKGLADIPRLLTTDATALSVHAQPTDATALSQERENELADDMARMMGCAPRKAS